MYVVVVGLGEVGRHLLQVLEFEGHDVVAIDRDPAAVKYAAEHFDVATLEGYGASEDILDKAGVGTADLLVAASDHDEVNLIAALAAKQLGAKRVIARVQRNDWAKWRAGIRYGLLGVDVVINPRVLVGQELGRVARSHGAVDVIDLAQDRVELVQMSMTSRMANRPLSKLQLPSQTLIAAYVRDGELVVPGGADVLLPGDTVYLIGRPEAILEAEDLFSTEREARRIVIVGGGVVGQALARELLPHGVHVTLIEQDEKVAEELAVQYDGLDVRIGDGTNGGSAARDRDRYVRPVRVCDAGGRDQSHGGVDGETSWCAAYGCGGEARRLRPDLQAARDRYRVESAHGSLRPHPPVLSRCCSALGPHVGGRRCGGY